MRVICPKEQVLRFTEMGLFRAEYQLDQHFNCGRIMRIVMGEKIQPAGVPQ